MGSGVRILPHYTYADYKHWEGNWELIEGIPHAMSPAPLPKHQYIASNLTGELRNALKKSGCKKCRASQPVDYKLAEDTIVQPDVLVYCAEATKPYLDFPPVFIAEILSPSTALKDRHTKYNLYEKAGVKWYVLVNPETDVVQIYLLENESYVLKAQSQNFHFTFDFNDNRNIEIDFAEIW
ncbi:MAG: Uma2 family endonuclease [Chitinophagaceae bacterium]|jgi:Uma2 family endonuclease|nr:Uma2 family endonuclease [Chitinophagaceae bacterium]